MPVFEITSPSGEVYEVTAPDGATEDQVLAYAKANMPMQAPQPRQVAPSMTEEAMTNLWRQRTAQSLMQGQPTTQAPQAQPQAPQAPQQPLSWSDVPGQALRNTPASAARFATNIFEAVTSPVQTFKSAVDLGTGAVRSGLRAVAPDFVARRDLMAQQENPESYAQSMRADQMASGAWDALKNRYGGSEEVKRTLATDPVGALADVSTALGIGAATAPARAVPVLNALPSAARTLPVVNRLPATVALDEGLNKLGAITNPLNLVAKPAGYLGSKAIDTVGANGLGTATGAGGEVLREAYKAGKAGGDAGDIFRKNMRGEVSGLDLVNSAREGIFQMKQNASRAYEANRSQWAQHNHATDFAQIDQAFADLTSSMQHRGKWKIGPEEQAVFGKIQGVLDEWRADPKAHTVEGFDAMKQRLQAIYPESPAHRQAQRAVTAMVNATKREITEKSPQYASAMKDYWQRLDEINEIERTLSLGDKATTDTALRKLTSLGRNNVNTNYGFRQDLAKGLQKGGADVMPAVAGQALSSAVPRGLQQLLAAGGFGAALAVNPWAAAAVPLTSPRLMGEASHAAGRLARSTQPVRRTVIGAGPAVSQFGALADLKRRTEDYGVRRPGY